MYITSLEAYLPSCIHVHDLWWDQEIDHRKYNRHQLIDWFDDLIIGNDDGDWDDEYHQSVTECVHVRWRDGILLEWSWQNEFKFHHLSLFGRIRIKSANIDMSTRVLR